MFFILLTKSMRNTNDQFAHFSNPFQVTADRDWVASMSSTNS